MKSFAFALFVATLSLSASSMADYVCRAPVNPSRGVQFPFEIQVKPVQVGGQILMKAGTRIKKIGDVRQLGEISKTDPRQKQAFDLTLGLIHEKDVSGIAPANLGAVTSIRVIKAQTGQGDEANIFQLLSGTRQIGGTIMISGIATACLP